MVLVTGLTTFVLWPREEEKTPPQLASAATKSLRAWRGVTYAGTTVNGNGAIIGFRLTVARDGTTYGTLSRDSGAYAEFAVSPKRSLLRGNRQWWFEYEPGSAEALAHTWVANPPQSVTGLAELSRMTPTALADALSGEGTDGPSGLPSTWRQSGATSVNGHPAKVLTDGTLRMMVNASPPYQPLSVGLPGSAGSRGTATPEPVPDASDAHAAVLRSGPQDGAARSAGHVQSAGQVAAVGEPAPAPALSSAISEPKKAQVQSTTENVRRVDASAEQAEPLSRRVKAAQTAVTVQLSTSFCSTPSCPATVNVANQGTAPASGTVIVTVAGQTPLNSAVSVPPGGNRTLTTAARNVAPPGQTIQVSWSAVFYEASVMGDDPALVKRLMGRGFQLNEPLGDQQANDSKGKPVLQLLDAMTPSIDQRTSPEVRESWLSSVGKTVANLKQQGAFEPFYDLAVNTDNLTVSGESGIAELAAKTAQLSVSDRRTLRYASDLARAGNKVVWGNTYKPEGSTDGYKADLQNLTGKQTIQRKAVSGGTGAVVNAFAAVINELSGTGVVPPGFDKVAWIDIDPNASTPLAGSDRRALAKEFRRLKLDKYCNGAGRPAFDAAVFTTYPPGPDGTPQRTNSVFTCNELLSSAIDPYKYVQDEMVWKANNDPVWYSANYISDGRRRSETTTENGVALPKLARDNENHWISKDKLPSAPGAKLSSAKSVGPVSVGDRKRSSLLDKIADHRKTSVDLTNAERKFQENQSVANGQARDKALRHYREKLGVTPNNSSIAERLGESAARYHVIPEEFPGAQWIPLPKTPNGADRFDQLYRLKDGTLLIVEAKAPSSALGWRQGKGRHKNKMVQQMTREYVETIIEAMKERETRSPRDGQLAHDLKEALDRGKLRYVLVKAKDGGSSYAGGILQESDIK
ncbi:hypothetical protein [Streptomyces alkaliterrae]|uniref:Uncharacterized protein n=1 Tax=Streptomyces alkaliterrae TaxID=2213162 RepID=A0A5P0YVR3_9ACTN|nr:hypothetical protein [Streptomyces alkaliterrae]MBB1260679.1 hypothetical protein [Streptomyces alkaliterrae]MQS04385.1 hypothetical protein [Streptomyces alkaliterrae]